MSVIFARERAKIINRKNVGLGFLDEAPAKQDESAPASLIAVARTVRVPAAQPVSDTATFWNEPSPGPDKRSTMRKSTKGKKEEAKKEYKSGKVTARGFSIFKNIIVQHESELEHTTSLCLQARPDVVTLYSQYPRLLWIDDEGKAHTHTADYFVRYRSGRTKAIVVKMEHKREEMLKLIERIRAYGLKGLVDDIVLVTNTYLTRERAENARAILWSRHFHDDRDIEILLGILSNLGPVVRFGDLLRGCNDRRARRVAIWRLIELGMLVSPTGEKITELTWLRRVVTQQPGSNNK